MAQRRRDCPVGRNEIGSGFGEKRAPPSEFGERPEILVGFRKYAGLILGERFAFGFVLLGWSTQRGTQGDGENDHVSRAQFLLLRLPAGSRRRIEATRH